MAILRSKYNVGAHDARVVRDLKGIKMIYL